ncbi:rubredoxin [Paenarthrobacter ilicis]|uniref:Rubredoxin n=1 Tax=Paenarthrobacter ilicis TaxID=43665 RepID=A0ABX0THJ4_9MICC|nr:rubredoxin [Paenarthrobacter ilicis]NIJ02008.1 rubredoxin [Paenarthrobacter ilicis]
MPRMKVPFWCANGHETQLVFLRLPDDQIPSTWDCPKCGKVASRDPGNPGTGQAGEEIYKSHLEYVKERRSSQEAEIVLTGALERLRARGVLPDQLLGDA